MNILISNDDGYLAPGIQELARRIRRFGNVTVVAPEQNHSGASNSLTLNRPLSARQVQENVFFVNGTPSDCVHIALTGLLPQKPDIVLSGINCGQNMGDDVLYSGTVAAAMEGFLLAARPLLFLKCIRVGPVWIPPRRSLSILWTTLLKIRFPHRSC